jgi:hypothetical protein
MVGYLGGWRVLYLRLLVLERVRNLYTIKEFGTEGNYLFIEAIATNLCLDHHYPFALLRIGLLRVSKIRNPLRHRRVRSLGPTIYSTIMCVIGVNTEAF